MVTYMSSIGTVPVILLGLSCYLFFYSFVELKGKTKICSYIFNFLSVVENIKLINA